jgi:hypothetical protein
MTTGFSLISLLSVASFAIAAGGLAVRFFWPAGPAKQHLTAASFIFLLLVSVSLVWQQGKEEAEVRRTADDIVKAMGSEKCTFEDILPRLQQPNYQIAKEAIDLLVDEKDIGFETLSSEESGEPHQIRLYHVRAF